MAGAIPRQRTERDRAARHRLSAGADRRLGQPVPAGQFRLDRAGPEDPRAHRPGSGAPPRPELGIDCGGHEYRDVGRGGDAGAGRHLPGRRGHARHRRAAGLAVDAAQSAIPAPERPHRPARRVRDARFRAGVSPDLAPRRRPDLDRAGRRGAGSLARSRGQCARAGGREARGQPAEVLCHCGRRHCRGERAVASLGLCRHPADAVHRRHAADDAAAELQPAVPGAERRADGPDRRGRRAAAVPPSRSASWRSSGSCRCSE